MQSPTSDSVPAALARGGPILVTGAGGFLGANVVWTLRQLGLPVRALVRRPPRGRQWDELERVEFAIGDICNPAQLERAMAGAGGVIHSAACTSLVPRPRRLAFQVNVEGTRQVCVAALRAGVRRLVFTSSLGTIEPGSAATPITETTPSIRPRHHAAYHVSKLLAERVIREFAGRGLDSIILCTAMMLGPRDHHPTTNQLLLSAARFPLWGMPPGGIPVIDVREAALAHVRALWLGEPGSRYLLAGPYVVYAELADLVKRMVGSSNRVRPLPAWTYLPSSVVLALLGGICPSVPNALSVPNFQSGFTAYHTSGALADRTFGLVHRPVQTTVADALRWFQDNGLAPWLNGRLVPSGEARADVPALVVKRSLNGAIIPDSFSGGSQNRGSANRR